MSPSKTPQANPQNVFSFKAHSVNDRRATELIGNIGWGAESLRFQDKRHVLPDQPHKKAFDHG